MKKEISFLIVSQIACILPVLSQSQANTAQIKQVADACPSWNKKQLASKADYFAYLSKRPKPQDNNNFYTPKYQNIVANKAVPAASSKKQPEPANEEKHIGITKAYAPAIVPEEENKIVKPEEQAINKVPDSAKPDEINKTEAPVKEKGKAISSSKKENKQTDSNKKMTEIKHQRKHLLRKTGFRKKCAADCPSF